jgi:hypothetical protein
MQNHLDGMVRFGHGKPQVNFKGGNVRLNFTQLKSQIC